VHATVPSEPMIGTGIRKGWALSTQWQASHSAITPHNIPERGEENDTRFQQRGAERKFTFRRVKQRAMVVAQMRP